MVTRMKEMRQALKDELELIGCPPPSGLSNWDHITNQIGMFSYTGLNADQVDVLVTQYNIYLMKSGRISVSGLTPKNVKYVAESFKKVMSKD